MPIKDVWRPNEELVSATPDTSIREICQLVVERKIGCVVIRAADEPTDIVTDRDVAMVVDAGGPVADLTVEDVMNRDPDTADSDDGIFELCATMDEHGVRRLPVVDGDELFGIVTLDDMAVLLDRNSITSPA